MDALTGVELGKVMLEGFHAGLNTAKEERKMTVPTMTIGQTEQASEVKKLEEENADLKERCRMYEARIEQLSRQAEHNYMRGRIDGLEFSIRCNGVSGDEVKK